jgi:hypothetical protein
MNPSNPLVRLVPAWDTSRTGTRAVRGLPVTSRLERMADAIPLRTKDEKGRPLYVPQVTYEKPGTRKAKAYRTGALVSLKRQAMRDRLRRAAL